jgi:hypothetical protein
MVHDALDPTLTLRPIAHRRRLQPPLRYEDERRRLCPTWLQPTAPQACGSTTCRSTVWRTRDRRPNADRRREVPERQINRAAAAHRYPRGQLEC